MLTYQNIVAETVARFPDFLTSKYYYPDELEVPDVFLWGFSRYIKDRLRTIPDSSNDPIIKQAIEFVQDMEWSEDSDLSAMALSAVMDDLVRDADIRPQVLQLFGEKSKEHLLGCMIITGVIKAGSSY